MNPEPKLAGVLVHPTAVIEAGAQLGREVRIGPHSWIRENVIIGDGTTIGASVVLDGWTTIGSGCTILHSSSVGAPPQDLKFRGEKSYLEIGDRNTIREFVTINRATVPGGKTVIGDGNLLMAYVHVAHECIIGSNTILANAVNIAGHVTIEDYAAIGGVTAIHQFVRIGSHSFVGGGSRIPKDVPPYLLGAGNPMRMTGINTVGLTRRGFSADARRQILRAYKILYRSNKNVSQAVAAIRTELPLIPEISHLIRFIEESERGIV